MTDKSTDDLPPPPKGLATVSQSMQGAGLQSASGGVRPRGDRSGSGHWQQMDPRRMGQYQMDPGQTGQPQMDPRQMGRPQMDPRQTGQQQMDPMQAGPGQPGQQQMDPQQVQLYYQNMYRQYQQAQPQYHGPKIPRPLGKPFGWLYKVGGAGFAAAGLLFFFYGLQSWIMFPIWFLMIFEEDQPLSMINMNILLTFFLAAAFIVVFIGIIGLFKNLGSKYSIAPAILVVFSIVLFVILAMILQEAAQAYELFLTYDSDESWLRFDQWDDVFFIVHILVNIVFGITIILLSIPFLQWKHINKMPKLSAAAGIMGIICGTLIIFTFLEFVGIVYFYAGVTFLVMALALFNIPVLDQSEWPLYVAVRYKEEMQNRMGTNPNMSQAYKMQSQQSPQAYQNAQMHMTSYQNRLPTNPWGSKDPYSDIVRFAENLKQS